MKMKKVKTSELSGVDLDWAVAKCEGLRVEYDYQYTEEKRFDGWWQLGPNHWQPLRKYSSDWAQGGPIIERESVQLIPDQGATYVECVWFAGRANEDGDEFNGEGPTPLIAAMRCYCCSILGDEIDIPEELV